MGQWHLGPVKNRPGGQRDLVTADGTLMPSLVHQFVGATMSALRADETIGPAAGREVLLAGFLGGEVALELTQRLGKERSGHASTLPVGSC